MAKGKPISFDEFAGLDLRKISTRADPSSFTAAKNLEGTSGKGIRTRPGTRTVARASEFSRGLYAANGKLYAVAPAGYPAIHQQFAPILQYAFIGNGFGYDADHIRSVNGFEIFGETDVGLGIPYISLTNKAGFVEHHYVDEAPTGPADLVATQVALPFSPSPGLIKMRERLFAPSNANGQVHYCKVGEPREWAQGVLEIDAGDLPVLRNAPNARTIQGLAYFRQFMVVVFEDSFQIWAVDTNQANMTLVEVLNGPGTRSPGALENVLGDTFYFSRGGFRRLSSAAIEGEREESDIGVRIGPFTKTLLEDPPPVGLWSQTRGQYLCAFGDQMVCFKWVPSEEIAIWTTWELPFIVTDLVELDGVVYARDAEHKIHQFDPDIADDDGVLFDWELKTQFLGDSEKAPLWQFIDVSMGMQGEAEVFSYPLQEAPDERESLGTWEGTSSAFERVYLGAVGPSLALGWAGQGVWQLDAFTIRVRRLEN